MIRFDEIASPEDARAYIRQALEDTDQYARHWVNVGRISLTASEIRWAYFIGLIAHAAGLNDDDLVRLTARLADTAAAGAA